MDKLKSLLSNVINLELMANPINWVVVILMVTFAGIALGVVFHPNNDQPGN
jgi:hypothetical protein